MEDKFIQLTSAVYRLLDFFPDEEPLKNRAKDKALAITEGLVFLQKNKAPGQLLEDIEILLNYLKFAKQKYNEGLNFKQDNPRINYITIAYNGVWTASGKNIYISSYEKIGYHTGSNAFYEGLKDSGIEIRDLRIKD